MTSSAAAIQELRREFLRRGWCRKATARVLLELLLNLSVAAAGAAVFFTTPHLLIQAAALVLVVAGSMGVATNTHNSSHYATSRKMWLNELLTYFGYPFFLGLSATFWWHQHVVVHHTAPNVIGVDQDADLAPWIARTDDEVARSSGLRRFYYQHLQWLVLPLIIAFNSFNMTKGGWLHLARFLSHPRCRTRKHAIDLAALVLHYAFFLVLPALLLGWRGVLALYLLRMLLMSYLMFAILAPGHFPAEAACLSRQPHPSDYLRLQTSATVNFRVGWVGRLLCSGLQHQIEHHLFPGISYVYYPKVSVVLREFCRKHGLPYRSYQWDHVLYKCFASIPPPTGHPHHARRLLRREGVPPTITQSAVASVATSTRGRIANTKCDAQGKSRQDGTICFTMSKQLFVDGRRSVSGRSAAGGFCFFAPRRELSSVGRLRCLTLRAAGCVGC